MAKHKNLPIKTVPYTYLLTEMSNDIHLEQYAWWHNPKTKRKLKRNPGELIALMHSELSEALEGLRKDKMDEHLPARKSVEVELADCIIRILDFCGAFKLDIGRAVSEKRAYNRKRADHKWTARARKNGKKF